ncbi:HipA domain-containing protein [Rhizobium sp. B230/85]|uniref:HipA domain-containing protein n=1 Tax=unclassified Rhizobium TaxID=2613769 RepID=UPI001ADAB538|nr:MULTISPECIES: HipA domain-containing protein [unclassified Rhizobium]MBO9135039.1 HipA domain-containing protein [Rhizobium sp. B209b/85]QXZ98044.1 HipA domain-containing protein [Rhizobium sp. B230/85]
MTSMDVLALDVRLDGYDHPVGILVRDPNGAIAFAYRSDYLSRSDATPLSLSLPLGTNPFEDLVARPFFDNLLQERDSALSDIMAREGLSRDDVVGLLYHLGKDCAGAISILPAGAAPTKVPGEYGKDYLPLDLKRLEAIVDALHKRKRLPAGMEDPSPLAGMQSKIALTVLPDGSLAEPVPGSGAPTTHILKVPDQDHLQDAPLENEAMRLSQSLGSDTADTVVLPLGGLNTLLVTRFDRALDQQNRIVRIHQEDFAQALGLPASLKYERRGAGNRRFNVSAIRRVLEATIDPAGAKEIFIRATLFDLLVGNADGHAKNFALLYERGGRIRMAPRYDILPIRLDEALTDELAYRIGEAETLDEITTDNFDLFLKTLGVDGAAARRRIRVSYTTSIGGELADHLDDLGQRGLKRLADLIASNIRTLFDAFGLEVPEKARDRDAFIGRGGGSLLS